MPATLARQVYAHLDAEWTLAVQEYEKQVKIKLPCGPACANCCKADSPDTPFVSLPMLQAEADLLWETLVALPIETQKLLIERDRSNYSVTCILLSPAGLCLVYSGRPWWCRVFGLPGIMMCPKIIMPPAGPWLLRWVEAAKEARQKLMLADSGRVFLRELIRRLANDR